MADLPTIDQLTARDSADGIQQQVVGAVIQDGERVLLLQRPVDDFRGGAWELPSGKVDPGESLDVALRREVVEETSLKVVSVSAYLGAFEYESGSGKRTRQHTWAVVVESGDIQLTEHDEYAWALSGEKPVSDEVLKLLGTARRINDSANGGVGDMVPGMDVAGDETRAAWAIASRKYEREYDEHLALARTAELLPVEVDALGGLVEGAEVVHPMSGHGLDDIALARLGARSVHGLDYSEAAVASAQRRADELGMPCRYTRVVMPDSGLEDACADLVYTGKGALIWVADLRAFFAEVQRLLRAGGWFYVYEAHPLAPLWDWHSEEIRVRPDRSYFAGSHVNDSYPGNGAVERQHTLAAIVMACQRAGFQIEDLQEHPEPFWRPGGATASAWDGQVPNTFSLLARRI